MKHLFVLLLFALLASCNSGTTGNSNETGDLPEITLQLTDGTFTQLHRISDKSVLVLFQPDCDHCQREAEEMNINRDAFSEYQVYFISASSMVENQQFAQDYGLDDLSNFHFGSTSVDLILQYFGSIPTPSVYIYSEKGILKSEFIGETPIEEILQSL